MIEKIKEVEILISILREKLELLSEILELTKLQTKAIQEEKVNKLENLIRSKQLRIDKIKSIDARFENQFDNMKQKYNIEEISELNITKDYLLELKKITEKVYKTMSQIYAIEKANNESIRKSFEDVKSKIREIKKGKLITSSYYKKTAQLGGYFIDKKK